MPKACQTGDQISGTCLHASHVGGLSVTGTWGAGSSKVKGSNGTKGIIRVNDTGTASCGHTFFAVTGSPKFSIQGLAVHRIGDTVNIQGGTGTSTTGTSVFTSV